MLYPTPAFCQIDGSCEQRESQVSQKKTNTLEIPKKKKKGSHRFEACGDKILFSRCRVSTTVLSLV